MPSQAAIEVRPLGESDPLEFEVAVSEPNGQTRHRVTLSLSDYRRLAGGTADPSQCVEAAFRFLLDREPKEAILRRFNLTLIGHYFPEFEAQLPSYLGRTPAATGTPGAQRS